MQILLDTANLAEIKKYNKLYNIAGVTSNPSIIAKEKTDFFPLLEQIRAELGPDKQLHVQVTGKTCDEMLREAQTITDHLGKDTYIKVMADETGLHAMKELKARGHRVTATGIYMVQQAALAGSTGVDCVIPYYNRIGNLSFDPQQAVGDMAELFRKGDLDIQIIAASVKSTGQVVDALLAGAHGVTVPVDILNAMANSPIVADAIRAFDDGWTAVYGNKRIYEL